MLLPRTMSKPQSIVEKSFSNLRDLYRALLVRIRALEDAPAGSGDMTKAVYDIDDDGAVDLAQGLRFPGTGDIITGLADDGEFLKINGTDLVSGFPTQDEVGLDQVDNTSDADKPVSDATQLALDEKIDKTEFTQKGGILIGTGAGTFNESAPTVDGQIPIADSSQPDGVRWDFPTGSGDNGEVPAFVDIEALRHDMEYMILPVEGDDTAFADIESLRHDIDFVALDIPEYAIVLRNT